MQDYFFSLADALGKMISPREVFTCFFKAEESDFVRFNSARVRQAGTVTQRELTVDLIEGKRHAAANCSLTGLAAEDGARVTALITQLRRQRGDLEDDPFLHYATDICSSEEIYPDELPDSGDAVSEILTAAPDLDLVGIWANGLVHRGFANSLGQRNWYTRGGFNFDWSCFAGSDKAVKCNYAGYVWQPAEMQERLNGVREQVTRLRQRPRTLRPGRYRAYLAPAAVGEILELLGWGGFGLESHRTLQTPLLRLVMKESALSPLVGMHEEPGKGLAPRFTAEGFPKPERVTLIREGCPEDCLVSARSGREYGVSVNADSEFPESLTMDGGSLPSSEVLQRLGTGLWINNLWYCNYSDRNDCRITGMTRFACFWIEHGQIRAPVSVMRFDESIYRMLGEKLMGLTHEQALIHSSSTYHERSTNSMRLPGWLVEDFTLTL